MENFRGSNIYSETLRLVRFGTRRIVHQGGQWSGKTVNIAGALAHLATEDEEPCVTTISSMSFPHLKGGALRDFEVYVQPYFKRSIKKYHKTDHIFTFRSGSIIEFKVFENEETARGPKRKRLFINEANKFDYMTYWQLDSRSEVSIIDYNPSIRFWSHEKVIGEPGTALLISDHRHNPFLTPQKHAEIEGIKNPELWRVYARGLTGNITGVIFPNWEMIDDSSYPKDEDFIWGIDFGYTNDPTAIMKMVLIGNTLFVKEIAYETGLAPKAIRQILLGEGYDPETMPLYCEHDPDMIKSLRKLDIQAYPARKGQGSINAGIELLNCMNVKYTASSKNLHRERGMYVWTMDKLNPDKATNIPTEGYNHCFVGSTMITTINGDKRIDEIKVGDLVLTSEGYKKVINVFNNGIKQVSEYFINGIRIISTPSHKIKTKYGWRHIQQLQDSDILYQLKASTAIKTVGLKHFEQGESWKEMVYDIEVEDTHEYFANGILVHNCFDAIRYGVYTRYLKN